MEGIKNFVVVVVLLVLTLLFCRPIMYDINAWNDMDFTYTFPLVVSSYLIVRHFCQLPLWSPYLFGGYYSLAHPYTNFLSPLFPLIIIFGPVIGFKLQIITMTFIGLYGVYILSRLIKINRIGAIGAAAIYMFSGYFASDIVIGGYVTISFAWIPYVFYFFLKMPHYGFDRNTVLAALFLALAGFEGGIYQLVYAAFAIVIIICFGLFRKKDKKFLVRSGYLFFLVFAFGFLAIKVIPGFQLLQEFPRYTGAAKNQYSLTGMVNHWLFHRNTVSFLFHNPVSNEKIEGYIYMGILPLLLALPAILLVARRARKYIVILTVAFLLILFGSQHTSLGIFWHILSLWYPFNSLNFSVRSIVIIYLMCGLGTGLTLTFFSRNKPGRFICLIIVIIIIADLITTNSSLWKKGFNQPPFQQQYPCPAGDFFQQEFNNVRESFEILWKGRGVQNLYSDLSIPRYAVSKQNPYYKGEVYAESKPNSASLIKFTPNWLTIQADIKRGGKVIINQNYFPGWHTTRGKLINLHGLIGVVLPPGKHRFTVYFKPWSFYAAVFALLLTLLLSFSAWRRKRYYKTTIVLNRTAVIIFYVSIILLLFITAPSRQIIDIIKNPVLTLSPQSYEILPEEIPDYTKEKILIIQIDKKLQQLINPAVRLNIDNKKEIPDIDRIIELIKKKRKTVLLNFPEIKIKPSSFRGYKIDYQSKNVVRAVPVSLQRQIKSFTVSSKYTLLDRQYNYINYFLHNYDYDIIMWRVMIEPIIEQEKFDKELAKLNQYITNIKKNIPEKVSLKWMFVSINKYGMKSYHNVKKNIVSKKKK